MRKLTSNSTEEEILQHLAIKQLSNLAAKVTTDIPEDNEDAYKEGWSDGWWDGFEAAKAAWMEKAKKYDELSK